MIVLQEYIMSELLKDHVYYYSELNDIIVIFFRKINRAYIERKGETAWLEAACALDAIFKYMEAKNLDYKDADDFLRK